MDTKTARTTIIGILVLLLLTTACGAPAKPPLTAQESVDLLKEWGFTPLLSSTATIMSDPSGKVTVEGGDMKLDFKMDTPPVLSFVEKGRGSTFKFDRTMPAGDSSASVIFTTSDVPGGEAEIPLFVPINTEDLAQVKINDVEQAISYLKVTAFKEYEGSYDFRIGFGMQNFSFSGFDTDIFYDGSTHYIFGEVKLFGVTFSNDSQEPLVFQISGDSYEYVSGAGSAATADGQSVLIGE